MEMKPVPGFDGYHATQDGRIFSTKKKGPPHHTAVYLSPAGYCYVNIWSANKHRSGIVHRMVMLAWGPPQPDGRREVNHKNGIKADNRLENLEWSNRQDNINHAIQTLGKRIGTCNRKLSVETVQEIRKLRASGWKLKPLSERFGIGQSHITQIVKRKLFRDVE